MVEVIASGDILRIKQTVPPVEQHPTDHADVAQLPEVLKIEAKI